MRVAWSLHKPLVCPDKLRRFVLEVEESAIDPAKMLTIGITGVQVQFLVLRRNGPDGELEEVSSTGPAKPKKKKKKAKAGDLASIPGIMSGTALERMHAQQSARRQHPHAD